MENTQNNTPPKTNTLQKPEEAAVDPTTPVGKTSNKMKFVVAGILATIALAAAAYKFGALKGIITK